MQVSEETIQLFKKAFENITPVITQTGTQITFQNHQASRQIILTKKFPTQIRGFGYSR